MRQCTRIENATEQLRWQNTGYREKRAASSSHWLFIKRKALLSSYQPRPARGLTPNLFVKYILGLIYYCYSVRCCYLTLNVINYFVVTVCLKSRTVCNYVCVKTMNLKVLSFVTCVYFSKVLRSVIT